MSAQTKTLPGHPSSKRESRSSENAGLRFEIRASLHLSFARRYLLPQKARMAKAHTATTMSQLLSELDDELLMLRVGRGDEASLSALIERWQTPMLNFFYRSINDYGIAEELTQTVFVRLYRAAPRYETSAKFSTYIFHIARRLLINEFHKRNRRPADVTDPAELHAVDTGTTGRDINELEEIFQQGLVDLPESQRTAILLLKQQELSYAEIATIMHSSESAVKTWIFRARQHLKQVLKTVV